MKKSFKRCISRFLTVTMLASAVFTNFTGFTVSAAGNTVDVWDFGGVQVADSLYTNHITSDFLDSLEAVGDAASGNKGKFLSPGDVDFNGITVNAVANDRLFYKGADGKRSYGTNGKADFAYPDGYTANGMYYANGTGGENRRYVLIKDVNAGDGISVYTGPSNSADTPVKFSCVSTATPDPVVLYGDANDDGKIDSTDAAVTLQHTLLSSFAINEVNADVDGVVGVTATDAAAILQKTLLSTFSFPVESAVVTANASQWQEDTYIIPGGEQHRADFVAKYSGEYKLWFDAAGGKPIVNRVVRYPAVTTTGKIDLNGTGIKDYSVSFKNLTTGDVLEGTVTADGYTADLTPGYTYTATLSGAVGYGFTNDTKTVDVAVADVATGKTADLKVEAKQTYKVSGSIKGFEAGYDLSKLVVKLVPPADSLADTVVADVSAELGYTATLEPDLIYDVVLEGVNDYEITAGAVVNDNKDIVQDITVAAKTVYNVSGKFIGLENAAVSQLSLVNVDDEYSYGAAVVDGGYAVQLRAGAYLAVATVDGYSTKTHVVVEDADKVQDILFVANPYVAPTVAYSKDVYVGCEGKTPNFETISQAMEAVKVMNPASEEQRITVHIAPGTYREQISIDTPYITFVKEGEGDVVLSWYYGIGYKYYSADSTGYYNVENDFDKYDKNAVSKWGVGTYIKADAVAFRAEGITFEASFNKYVTDVEVMDGVESDGSIAFVRTLGADVTSRAAVERSSAIAVESDNTEFKDCTFIGSQDTLYIGNGKVNGTPKLVDVYFKNCIIEGNTDYIFGSGDAVFDGCELRFCGYSDTASGGYITAARKDNMDGYNGYLFRGCTVTNKDGMKHSAGFFGRPWDANAAVYFYNTKLENADAITAAGWNDMSGVKPDVANFKEFNTTYAGKPVDVSGRVSGTVQSEGSVVDPATYFGADWTPVYYTVESDKVEYATAPYFSTDGDVLLPATGDTFTVKYDLGANAGADASRIDYYSVAADGSETLVKTTSAIENEGILITNALLGKTLKAVVTPILVSGKTGEAVTLMAAKEVTEGSGYHEVDRPSGKSVIFLAGDSTVKDYSAGAINNSGANRSEGSWGEFFGYFIDNSKYEVMNYAQGGRSSRTFLDGTKADGSDRYLDMIKKDMVAGDYLFIQFGHNDCSESYADRYVPVGTPDADGQFPYTAPSADGAGDGSFKWYLQQYVDAAKAVGATPVMVTPVARMYFNADGKIYSHHGKNDEYVTATMQVAKDNNILCFDLYNDSKLAYEKAYQNSPATAERLFAYGEKTHHSKLGGFVLAAAMISAVQQDGTLAFANAVVKPASLSSADDKGNIEFKVWSDSKFEGYAKNADGVYDEKLVDTFWTEMVNNIIIPSLNTVNKAA